MELDGYDSVNLPYENLEFQWFRELWLLDRITDVHLLTTIADPPKEER